jgi:hypothetical protein
MLFVVVVDALVVHQRPLLCCTTRSSTMVDMMMHIHGAWIEEGPTTEGDEDQCTNDLLKNFMKSKKHKISDCKYFEDKFINITC